MPNLHDPTIGKGRKIVGYLLSIIPSLAILMSGVAKLIGVEQLAGAMKALNLLEYMPHIGALEIFCVLLYWIPRTTNIGFFLLCSYVGGIIACELSLGSPFLGIAIATMLYIGTMLRRPAMSGLGI